MTPVSAKSKTGTGPQQLRRDQRETPGRISSLGRGVSGTAVWGQPLVCIRGPHQSQALQEVLRMTPVCQGAVL